MLNHSVCFFNPLVSALCPVPVPSYAPCAHSSAPLQVRKVLSAVSKVVPIALSEPRSKPQRGPDTDGDQILSGQIYGLIFPGHSQ